LFEGFRTLTPSIVASSTSEVGVTASSRATTSSVVVKEASNLIRQDKLATSHIWVVKEPSDQNRQGRLLQNPQELPRNRLGLEMKALCP
jgi:hypothetical protein